MAGRNMARSIADSSDETHEFQTQIDELDPGERDQDAAHAVDQEIAAQKYRSAQRPVPDALRAPVESGTR